MHRKAPKFLAIISSLSLVLALGACSNEKENTATQPVPVEAAPSDAPSDGGSSNSEQTTGAGEETAGSSALVNSDCSLPAGDQSIPNTAPKVDEWVNVTGIGIPTSAIYGPQKREGDLFGCYAHSPTGALFAMTYFMAASDRVDGFNENWLTPEDQAIIPKSNGSKNEGDTAILRGFRFSSATKDQVVADLAWDFTTDEGDSATIVQRFITKWDGDRWVMDLKMLDTPPSKAPDNLDGFTRWSANNG